LRKSICMGLVSIAILISSAVAMGSVYISAINFDAPGNDHQNLNGEWVKITNSGPDSVTMTGWRLSDEGNKHVYRFPTFALSSGSGVTVYTGSGMNTATALYMGFKQAVWNNDGDTATLRDSAGNIISQKGN
jgi:hypothetical protein